jgi:hypothetical protein
MISLDSLDNYELRPKVTKKNELNVYMIVIFLHQGIGLQDEVILKNYFDLVSNLKWHLGKSIAPIW